MDIDRSYFDAVIQTDKYCTQEKLFRTNMNCSRIHFSIFQVASIVILLIIIVIRSHSYFATHYTLTFIFSRDEADNKLRIRVTVPCDSQLKSLHLEKYLTLC